MNVTINLVELATELAENQMIKDIEKQENEFYHLLNN
jgi:hypothetical protein